MANLDLDKARAARAEANGEAPTVTFGGVEFLLPVELPFSMVEDARKLSGVVNDPYAITEAISAISRSLFGDRYEEFLDYHPSMGDMQVLMDSIAGLYGMTPGESAASEG